MPSRIVREGILDSEAVNSLSEEAELFYRRLMSVVDDHGRFEDKLELIRARCFPLRLEAWPPERVEKCLSEVSKPPSIDRNLPSDDGQMTVKCLPLVSRYVVDGRKYLQINNFGQRTRVSKFPAPPNDGHLTVTCPSDDGGLPPSRARVSKAQGEGVGEGARRKAQSETKAEAQQQQAAAGPPAAAVSFEVLDAVQFSFPTARAGDKWESELAGVKPEEYAAVAESIRNRPVRSAHTPVVLVREAVAEVRIMRQARSL